MKAYFSFVVQMKPLGVWEYGIKHGNGILTTRTGDVYTGEFKNDMVSWFSAPTPEGGGAWAFSKNRLFF